MTIQRSVAYPSQPPADELVEAILSSWIDGILILTKHGEWVKSNPMAQQICDRITQEHPHFGQVPKEIWRTCQVLIQNHREHPDCQAIAESELQLKSEKHFRIRARWLNLSDQSPHILVILEDQRSSKQNLAITEIDRYDLSSREADVWLLYRTGYSYQDIADKLFIAINTVKRHMKKIYAKRRLALMMDNP